MPCLNGHHTESSKFGSLVARNMTDVRSMLRTERAARRINHPQAQYSSSGLLSCSICSVPVKSEAFWDSHLRSGGHNARLRQLNAAKAPEKSLNRAPPNKKRKVDEEKEEDELTGRKKPRNGQLAKAPTSEDKEQTPLKDEEYANGDEPQPEQGSRSSPSAQPRKPAEAFPAPQSGNDAVDEDEWAAFERDIAGDLTASGQPQAPLAALQAAPTITAKPLTASELAAQAREEQSMQKGSRDMELEEEREEASRQAEEELDRMAQLDEKMKAWREKKEALRSMRGSDSVQEVEKSELRISSGSSQQGSSDEDDEDDEWDPWHGFGGAT